MKIIKPLVPDYNFNGSEELALSGSGKIYQSHVLVHCEILLGYKIVCIALKYMGIKLTNIKKNIR